MLRIMGIDPGSRCIGWGVIEWSGQRVAYCAGGIVLPSRALCSSQRLGQIHDVFYQLVDQHQPKVVALEETFVNRSNPQSALILGQARGALMSAVGRHATPLCSYAPNVIKKALTGYGHSSKDHVMKMVILMMPQVPRQEKDDFYDALAVALCHGQHQTALAKMRVGGVGEA